MTQTYKPITIKAVLLGQKGGGGSGNFGHRGRPGHLGGSVGGSGAGGGGAGSAAGATGTGKGTYQVFDFNQNFTGTDILRMMPEGSTLGEAKKIAAQLAAEGKNTKGAAEAAISKYMTAPTAEVPAAKLTPTINKTEVGASDIYKGVNKPEKVAPAPAPVDPFAPAGVDKTFTISSEMKTYVTHANNVESLNFAKLYAAAKRHDGDDQKAVDKFDKAYTGLKGGHSGFVGSGVSYFKDNSNGIRVKVERHANGKGFWGTDHHVMALKPDQEPNIQ